MDILVDILSAVLMLSGAGFFTAGTIGLIRFPDVRSRLHALTKADTLGLGLIFLGVALQLRSVAAAVVLLTVWLTALLAAALSAALIAGKEASQ